MIEALTAIALATPSIIGAAVWYRLGKINGGVKQNSDDLEHIKKGCPLWGNPGHHLEKDP